MKEKPKGSFLSKAASVFVTREPSDEGMPQLSDEELETLAGQSEPTPVAEVDSSQIQATDVIRSIYAQGEFKEDESLFRLDGFISTLPKEMPTETKQGSIAGILRYSGIDINVLIDDGQRKLAMLIASKDQLKADNKQREDETNEEIEQMKQAIQEAERRISEDRHTTEASCNAIEAEAAQLKALLDFAAGVASK